MSTDQTPALARATEAFEEDWNAAVLAIDPGAPALDDEQMTAFIGARIKVAVSAALHDPDDPDALAREYVARLAHESWETGCQRVCFHATWDDMAEPDRNVIRAQLDAVRAAILGSDR